MWLAFLRNPDEHGALLRSALPEAFAEEGDAPLPGDDLAAFLSAYRRLTALLSAQVGDARRLLLSAAISEERGGARTPSSYRRARRVAARSVAHSFARSGGSPVPRHGAPGRAGIGGGPGGRRGRTAMTTTWGRLKPGRRAAASAQRTSEQPQEELCLQTRSSRGQSLYSAHF